MLADYFEARIARVRHRFASSLESKIKKAMSSAEHISRNEGNVAELLSDSYRHLHNIHGIGPTVGFSATGEAAHEAETALMQAYLEKRGLTEEELLHLKEALVRLRDAAASEIRLMHQLGR